MPKFVLCSGDAESFSSPVWVVELPVQNAGTIVDILCLFRVEYRNRTFLHMFPISMYHPV